MQLLFTSRQLKTACSEACNGFHWRTILYLEEDYCMHPFCEFSENVTFPLTFTYNSFVEVFVFVVHFVVLSRGAIEIDKTGSKLWQKSYEIQIRSTN